MNNQFVEYEEIKSLFLLLNNNNIDYVLLRNLDDELPNRLQKNKDIDILINPQQKKEFLELFKSNNWIKNIHPWDFGTNFIFLYSMDKFIMLKKNNIHLDVCFQLACRSLNNGEWFPLDEDIQESCFKNKLIVTDKLWKYRLSYEDEMIHLLTRSIFDKKTFTQTYIDRIKELLTKIELEEFKSKLEKVFFNFSPFLINLISSGNFSEIRKRYISFKEY